MKKVVLMGGGKRSLILDVLKKNQTTKEDFKSHKQERKKNIIEKNENAFVD